MKVHRRAVATLVSASLGAVAVFLITAMSDDYMVPALAFPAAVAAVPLLAMSTLVWHRVAIRHLRREAATVEQGTASGRALAVALGVATAIVVAVAALSWVLSGLGMARLVGASLLIVAVAYTLAVWLAFLEGEI